MIGRPPRSPFSPYTTLFVSFLLRRIANLHPSLSRLSDALSLIALGGFGSAIVSASIGVSVLYATHVRAYSGLGAAWLVYWLGEDRESTRLDSSHDQIAHAVL